jgi:small conductance mechanosensitive channel
MDESLEMMDRLGAIAADMAIRFAPKVVVAILILAAGYFFSRWAARMLSRGVQRFHLEPPVRSLLERAVQVVVLGLFLVLALQNLGVELLPLIAGLGVAGAGIALAMQGVLGNAAAGLTIIFTRPFRVGEYISIAKEEGEVLEVTLFDTVLGHADRSRVVIPNRKIAGEILHNYGKIRQLGLEVAIARDGDVEAALAAIREVLAASAVVLKEPVASVGVARLGEAGVVIAVSPWVAAADYASAGGELNQAILAALRGRGIERAVPQREIRMISATASVRDSAPGRNVA